MEVTCGFQSSPEPGLKAASYILAVTALSKAFGSKRVLEGVNLTIETGTSLAILGPSGAGKTTLLRVLAGLETPDSGTAVLGGINLFQTQLEKRRVAIVPQQYSLFPMMTAIENVEFPLLASEARTVSRLLRAKLNRQSRERRRREAGSLLELVRISHLADRFMSQLSGGEQQRVAIARAIAAKPALLCLDEPFAALDHSLRQDIHADLASIRTQLGIALLLVTHDREEAASVCSHIAILLNGRVIGAGPAPVLFASPTSRAVATVVGGHNVLSSPSQVANLGGAPEWVAVPWNRTTIVASSSRALAPCVPGTVLRRCLVGQDWYWEVRLASGQVARGLGSSTFLEGQHALLVWEKTSEILLEN